MVTVADISQCPLFSVKAALSYMSEAKSQHPTNTYIHTNDGAALFLLQNRRDSARQCGFMIFPTLK